MQRILVVPGALIGAPDWDEAAQALIAHGIEPALAPLRRAPRHSRALRSAWSDGAAHLQWLADAFRVTAEPPPTAAYAWQADAGQDGADADQVWFCDPVHLILKPDRTVLSPIERPALDENELASLLADAANSAHDAGARLQVQSGRWYLRLAPGWDLQSVPLQAALGAPVEARLPRGADAWRWRRLLNEVQMRWHANPVNQAREARGEPTAMQPQGVGGGRWQPLPTSPFARIEGDDPVLIGWQRAAVGPAPGRPQGRLLSVWPDLFESYWRRDWPAWAAAWTGLQRQLQGNPGPNGSCSPGKVDLIACGRRSAAEFSIGCSGFARLARRALVPRSLRDCLLEPTA